MLEILLTRTRFGLALTAALGWGLLGCPGGDDDDSGGGDDDATADDDDATAGDDDDTASCDLPAPVFAEVQDHLGQMVSPDALVGHATVMWFYPIASTSG